MLKKVYVYYFPGVSSLDDLVLPFSTAPVEHIRPHYEIVASVLTSIHRDELEEVL